MGEVITGLEWTVAFVCFAATYIVLWGLTGWRSGRIVHAVIVMLSTMAFLAMLFVSTYIGGSSG